MQLITLLLPLLPEWLSARSIRKRTIRVLDPSVGAGNLLLAAIEQHAKAWTNKQIKKLIDNLYGVEIDPCARELCCLLIWLAGADCGASLKRIAQNILVGNALTMDWWRDQELYDVVLVNPPWESLRHQVDNDEYGERAATRKRLSELRPGAIGLPPLYSAQGTGDRNLFKAFVELVPHLLSEGGRLGALLPAAFASDAGLAKLRERYCSQFAIAKWTSFENRAKYFPIDSRYKFGLLSATRSDAGTAKMWVRGFATEPREVNSRHVYLRRHDISLIGGGHHIIPELTHKREVSILRSVLQTGSPFFEPGPLGEVKYKREIDLSLAKGKFHHFMSKQLRSAGDGSFVDEESCSYVPLVEGRFVGAYDCFQKSWISGKGRSAVWARNDSLPLDQCKPQYVTSPASDLPPRVALCDVTSATNTRTVIATFVPTKWRCGNTAPVLEFDSRVQALAGLATLNSMVFDWIARRLVSGLHLNKFILEGFAWPAFSPAQTNTVAFAAWSICVSMPRSGLSKTMLIAPPFQCSGGRKKKPMPPNDAFVAIESIVAKALGLSSDQLGAIFDSSESDRRGLWRYFDTEPNALKNAKRAVQNLRAA